MSERIGKQDKKTVAEIKLIVECDGKLITEYTKYFDIDY